MRNSINFLSLRLFFLSIFLCCNYPFVGSSFCQNLSNQSNLNNSTITKNGVISKDFFAADVMFFNKHLKKAYFGKDIYQLMRHYIYLLKELGIGMVGMNLNWGEIEPKAPRVKQHFYNWEDLDKILSLLHENNIGVKLQIFPSTNWASKITTDALNRAGPIKENHINNWREFIQKLVERYDGDGLNDAFQMRKSVLRIVNISGEVEANNNWSRLGGTPEEYDWFLTQSTRWIREINQTVLIARGGVNFGKVFDGLQNDKELFRKIDTAKKKHSQPLLFFLKSIQDEDKYDLFPVQLNYGWSGIIPQINWIKKELKKFGYSKPIYGNHARTNEPNHLLEKILLNPKSSDYREAKAQYFRNQSSNTIKKLIAGLACGLNHMFVATIFDGGFSGSPGAKQLSRNRRGLSWSFAGLIDGEMITKAKDISDVTKPVYHSYKIFISKILGCSREIKALHLGPNVKAFCLKKKGKSIYILWYEDIRNKFKNSKNPSMMISLPISSDKALITQIVTEINQIKPKKETIIAKNEKIDLILNDIPVFVEEL